MCSPVSVIARHLFESRLVEQGSVMAILQVILFGRIIARLRSGAGNRSVVKSPLSKHCSTKSDKAKFICPSFDCVVRCDICYMVSSKLLLREGY
jgi:hypothetical protein